MQMPEASVHKDGNFPARQHNVRAPWEANRSSRESEAPEMEGPTDLHLRLSISTTYAGHHLAPDFRIHNIDHTSVV